MRSSRHLSAAQSGPAHSSGHADNPPAPRKTRRNLRWVAALAVLGIGVAESLLSGWQVKQTIEDEAKARFEGTCDEVTTKIHERLTSYAVMLQGGQALFSVSDKVTRDQWRTYVETLDAWEIIPGVLGVGFVLLIKPQELDDHVRQMRKEGFADYDVKPPGSRDVYTSIIYLEPFSGRNLRAFGYDMFSEPVRREAMERARDTGDTALSGKVTLVQEDGTDVQAGSLMYVPVYRKGVPTETPEEKRAALFGWVYSAYRMRDLMTGIIPDWSLLGRTFFELRIYDGDSSPEKLLFDSAPGTGSRGVNSMLAARRVIEFNGHHWLLEFTGKGTVGGIDYAPAWRTALGGLVITGLLFGMLLLAFKRQDALRRTEKLAEQIRGMAFHDSLTKLPNRLLLRDRLEMALAAGKRSGGHGALMMVDLDNFKPLNDERGHAAGDLLLIEVAQRIRGCVRETDTVARIGGDEFVVLLANLAEDQNAARREAGAVAEKIVAALSQPYRFEPSSPGEECIEHRCSASIGITLFSGGEASHSGIIKRADDAMYLAKRSGRNRAHFDMEERTPVSEPSAAVKHA